MAKRVRKVKDDTATAQTEADVALRLAGLPGDPVGRLLSQKAVDLLRADTKKSKGSTAWKLSGPVLLDCAMRFCAAGQTQTAIIETYADAMKRAGVAERSMRRWLSHVNEAYVQLQQANTRHMLSELSDFVPGRDDVVVAGANLAAQSYKHALFLLAGGDDGEPPTQKEMGVILRTLEAVARTPALHAEAQRSDAQARLLTAKTEGIRSKLHTALQTAPQNTFTQEQMERLVDAILDGEAPPADLVPGAGGAA